MAELPTHLKKIAGELKSWLPSESAKFQDFFWSLLASIPGGDEAESAGHSVLAQMGWKEVSLIANTLGAIKTESDTEALIQYLSSENEDVRQPDADMRGRMQELRRHRSRPGVRDLHTDHDEPHDGVPHDEPHLEPEKVAPQEQRGASASDIRRRAQELRLKRHRPQIGAARR
jgi:hypothetical protein